jgi:hypothetical protein
MTEAAKIDPSLYPAADADATEEYVEKAREVAAEVWAKDRAANTRDFIDRRGYVW